MARLSSVRRGLRVLTVGATALALSSSALSGVSDAVTTTGLRVSGNTVLLNKVAFVPRGFSMIGALAGPGCMGTDVTAASVHLTLAELTTLATGWHANTVRFQVSQKALSDPVTRAPYLATVAGAVGLARAAHLVVILSMQDNNLSCGSSHDLPSAATQQAWVALAPVYATAPDVMYELFNEPDDRTAGQPVAGVPLPAASWSQWLSGGSTPDPNQDGAIGHQQLLQQIRGLGARNVVLADGLNQAGILPGPNQGAALLHDTMIPPNIAYAVHPYYFTGGATDWDFRFGSLSATVPVVATEWNYKVTECGTTKPAMAPGFLNYLSDHAIGVVGMSGDLGIGSTLLADWAGTATVCGVGPDGPGVAFATYLAGVATPRSTTLTLASTTPVAPGSALTVTGTLLINGVPPTAPMVLTPTRKDGTVTTKLAPIVTEPGGVFAFDGGSGTIVGQVRFTVKYAGNGVTSAAARTIVVKVVN